jgi:quinol monooxygenase YgiN
MILLVATALLAVFNASAQAEPAAGASATVTYIEVVSTAVKFTRQSVMNYVEAARRDPDAVRIEALEQMDRAGHFALLEQWKSPDARSKYSKGEIAAHFRSDLNSLRAGPYDERPHIPLLVQMEERRTTDQLVVLTHVDIIPTSLELGLPKVKELVIIGREAPGNIGFDLLIQANRQNHMTIVETWRTRSARDEWIASTTMRRFREEFAPFSGSLYDERLYRILD